LDRRFFKDKIQICIIVCITAYTLIFSYFTIMRHYSFDSGAWDLGTYEQMLWTTIHSGKLFWAAPDPINPTGFFFGTHFSPILFIILPIYFLHQATETLLILQSFVLALGALPLYWLARDELKSKIAGLIIAVAYLAYGLYFVPALFLDDWPQKYQTNDSTNICFRFIFEIILKIQTTRNLENMSAIPPSIRKIIDSGRGEVAQLQRQYHIWLIVTILAASAGVLLMISSILMFLVDLDNSLSIVRILIGMAMGADFIVFFVVFLLILFWLFYGPCA